MCSFQRQATLRGAKSCLRHPLYYSMRVSRIRMQITVISIGASRSSAFRTTTSLGAMSEMLYPVAGNFPFLCFFCLLDFFFLFSDLTRLGGSVIFLVMAKPSSSHAVMKRVFSSFRAFPHLLFLLLSVMWTATPCILA